MSHLVFLKKREKEFSVVQIFNLHITYYVLRIMGIHVVISNFDQFFRYTC